MGNETVRVSVRVPERYRRRLKIAAATQGEKLEEWLLRALDARLEPPSSTASQAGQFGIGALTAEEQRSLLRYLDLIRTNEGLAGLVRQRVEQFLAVAREQAPAVDYANQAALVERIATEAMRVATERLTAQFGQLALPLPGTPIETVRANSGLAPTEPPTKTS